MPNLQLRHLVTLMPALLALGCGGSAPGDSPTPYEVHPRGSWVDSRFDQRAGLMSTEERAALGLLDELGYSAGGAAAPRESGVVRWDRERSAAGLNLYCSGHGAEAILMDMSGEVLHRWAHPYEDLPAAPPPAERYQGAWRRLHLFDDGSLLAIHEGLALVKVDRDSRRIWHRLNQAHHDLDVTSDGHVWVLTRKRLDEPALSRKASIEEDWIEELDAEGRPLRRLSIVRALWNSAWSSLLTERADAGGDLLHANTLEVLREEPRVPHPAFRPGRILISLREIDAVALIDMDAGVVVWLQAGPWNRQHQPTVLENGHLLVFDNMGWHGYSRLLEFDVPSREIVWQYAAENPVEFFSIFSGSAQRLPGGNTLASLSFAGRAVEVTPAGEVVWEFVSPHRAGEEDELVAVLYDVQRLSEDSVHKWLR
jgi:hypothetical protein